jgi:penicillin-binding protein 2
MVSLMAAIANDGTVYQPRLIKQIEDRDGKVIKSFPVQVLRTVTFDEKNMPLLKAAMINVIDNGTATVVHRDDMKIAAKTGTAQVGTDVHRRQIAWLSGYLPADNPQYSFSIMVEGTFADNRNDTLEGGLLGGVDAGGIAKDMFDIIYPPPGKKDAPLAAAKTNDSTPATTDSQAAAADADDNAATPADASPAPTAKPAATAPALGDGAPSTP